jgi:hypothetical protein
MTLCDVKKLRVAVEKLIDKENSGCDALRIPYADSETGKDLMLFIRKGYRFGIMQMWILEGICESKDYDESMEADGSIRKWLEVEIDRDVR